MNEERYMPPQELSVSQQRVEKSRFCCCPGYRSPSIRERRELDHLGSNLSSPLYGEPINRSCKAVARTSSQTVSIKEDRVGNTVSGVKLKSTWEGAPVDQDLGRALMDVGSVMVGFEIIQKGEEGGEGFPGRWLLACVDRFIQYIDLR